MRKILSLLLLLSNSAYAADNAVILDPGATIIMRTKDVGSGVQSPYNILGDLTGTSIYGTAGTANANVLSIQGITSGTPINVTLGAETTKVIGTVRIASGGVASGSYASGSIASGAMVDFGSQADSICGTATGTCSLIGLIKFLNNGVTSAIPAGSAIIGKVGIDQTTPGTTNAVSFTNTTIAVTNAGTFATQAASTQSGTWTVQPGNTANTTPWFTSGGTIYETVAASQTGQTLGPTGATGDYLSHCVVYPTSTTPGVVTVFDSTSSATNNVILFPGGASSVSNLVPFAVPVGAISVNGAWKVTTGANVSVNCFGKFT